MALSRPPPASGKDYRIRPLKRGDRDAVFRLLADDGWKVAASDQELAISWVVQHPEMESFVAHDAGAYSRLYGMITMSHRPQLKLGGRVASIDLFIVSPEQRGRGIGHDLLTQAIGRAQALACKRMEVLLPEPRDDRHDFFEGYQFVNNGFDLFIRAMT
ncbi:MAG TPA: GNAT family N-acetyltransferase [Myxococcales bacterium]|nr:GNAT family N-acetyltransferase [Myxococcales bacterium]